MTGTMGWVVAAIAGATAVAAGAFGAHALRAQLTPEALQTFQTGAAYHLVHAVALLAIVVALQSRPAQALVVAAWAIALGIVLFSGSLYALALGGPRWLGPVTPLGGVAFIVGWLAVGFSGWFAAGD